MENLDDFLSKGKKWFDRLIETIREYAKKLEESEKWFSTTLGSIGDAVIATDRLGNVQFLNPIAESLTGWKQEESIGKPLEDIFKIINEETRKLVENPVSRVIREGVIIGLANHTVLITKSGNEIPIADSGAPIKDDKGDIIGVVLIFRDITERRKAEKEIVNLAKFPSENPNPILRVTKESIIYTNKAGESIFSIKEGDTLPELFQDAVNETFNLNTPKLIEIELNNRIYTLDISPIKEEGYANIYGRNITERRKAEEAQKKSEVKYRSLFDNMLDGFAYCKIITNENNEPVDFIYLEINNAFESLTGLKKENVLGKRVTEAIPGIEHSEPNLFEIYGKVTLTGEPTKFEIFFTPLKIWLSIAVYSPEKGYFVAVFKNITERKKVEEELNKYKENLENLVEKRTKALSESEEKHKNLVIETEMILDHIPGLIFYKDAKNNFIRVNKYLADAYNMTKEELTGKNLFDLYPKEVAQSYLDDDLEVIKSGKPKLNIEEPWDTTEGRRWVSTSKIPNFDAEGKITGIIGFSNDITERKNAEKALKESKQQLEKTLYSLHDAVFNIDAKTVEILDCNPAASEIFGYSREDMIGQTTRFLHVNDEHLEEFRRDLNPAIEKYGFIKNFEFKMKRKDGTILNTEHSVLPLLDENNHRFGWVSVVHDITKRKLAEQKLKESEIEYREAYNRTEFYKDLFTHDINNILQGILSGVELSKMHMGDLEKHEKLNEINSLIKDQVMRGARLVSNISKLSKLEETEISFKQIEICSILEKSITYVKNSYHARKITIQIDSISKKLYIHANELLEDVFENILVNAVKYSENPIIEIIVKISKEQRESINYLKMEFLDNGIGIGDLRKGLIFQRGSSEETSVHGLGLGLSLVKKIIEAYNGKIWVEDRVKGDHSKGSNFVLLIPEV